MLLLSNKSKSVSLFSSSFFTNCKSRVKIPWLLWNALLMKSCLCNQIAYCSAPESRCGLNTGVNTTVIYEHLVKNLITGTIIPDSHTLRKAYTTQGQLLFSLPYFSTEYSYLCISLVLFSSVILFYFHFFF